MIRARLVREVSPGVLQFLIFIGPIAQVPAGWIVITRKPAKRK
jgi:hypothetical protein